MSMPAILVDQSLRLHLRVMSHGPVLAENEQWGEASKGKIRADKVHQKLLELSYDGSQRSTRRAVAEIRVEECRLGHVPASRPWVTESGMWLQYDSMTAAMGP